MLLYQGKEPSAIQAIRFSADAACLAVATQSRQVRWFEAAQQITPRGGCECGIDIADLAFAGAGQPLTIIGRASKSDGYPESELTVLITMPFDTVPIARHRLPLKVDGRLVAELFAAPIFLPPPLRSGPLLVGTVDGAVGIDPADGSARFPLVTEPDFGFVAHRGLVYLPSTATLVAAFDMHPGLWLIAYRPDAQGQFHELRTVAQWDRAHLTGAALSPSGHLLAVSTQEDFYLHPAEIGADAPLGVVHVYETEGLAKIRTFEIRASLERDFGRQDLAAGDGRRIPRGGGPASLFMYLPLALMSNPAFLDDRRLALGMPGGEVRLLDVETGRVEGIPDGPHAPVRGLDCAPAKQWIAAGFADGTVRVWSI